MSTTSLLSKYGLSFHPSESILLALFLVIGLSLFLGELFERIGLDAVLGQLLAGVLLGGSLLNLVDPHQIEEFAIVGSVLILFLAGLNEKNEAAMLKDRVALKIGLSILISTFIVMALYFSTIFTMTQAIFLGLAYAVIDLGVPAKLLLSRNLLNTQFGMSVLNISVVNIFVGLSLLTVFSIVFGGGYDQILGKVVGVGIFIALFMLASKIMSKMSKGLAKLESAEAQFSITFITVLLFAYLTDILGFSAIMGAFLAGMIVAKSEFSETRAFADKIKALSYGIFVPLFFGWFGLELDLIQIWKFIGIASFFVFLSLAVKFSVTYFLAHRDKLPAPGMIASSMLSLDIESLIIILMAVKLGVFMNNDPLNIFAPAVPITTVVVAVLIKFFSKLEKKDLKSLS